MRKFHLIFIAVLFSLIFFSCDNVLIDEIGLMRAEAVSPVISVTYGDEVLGQEDNHDFGLVSVDSTCEAVFTVKNSGKSALTIDISIAMKSGTTAGVFVLATSPAEEVAAGGSTSFSIAFRPESEGDNYASVTITSNDFNNPTYSFNLSGSGWMVGITTDSVSGIEEYKATCGGDITDNGGASITERGICWSTDPYPTVDDYYVRDGGTGTGSFSALMTGLAPGTFYYVRAWASNGISTGYGSQNSFTTKPETPSISSVSAVPYADGSGKLAVSWTSDNGSATSYDVYYSTADSAPGTANGPTGLTAASCTLTGLTDYSEYYVWVTAKTQSFSSTISSSANGTVGIPVTGITLDKDPQGFLTGMTETVIATVLPETATNLGIEWSCSNTDFSFTTDGDGRSASIIVTDTPVTAAAETVYIYIKSADGKYETTISPRYHANSQITGTNALLPGPSGGYVFYDKGSYSDGWRYLEVAPDNIGGGIPWSYEPTSGDNVSASATYLLGTSLGADEWGTGKSNTETIVDTLGVGNYMARACVDYSSHGYDNWFMPSWGEANHYFNVMQNVYDTYYPGTDRDSSLFPGFNIFVCSSKDANSIYSWVYWFNSNTWYNNVTTSNDGDNVTRPIREF